MSDKRSLMLEVADVLGEVARIVGIALVDAHRCLPVPPPVSARFFEGHIVEAPGGRISAGDLYRAFQAASTGEPVSQNRFGRIAGAALQKEGTRYPAYVGIVLRGPRLAVVAA